MGNLDKLAALPERAKNEFELAEGVTIPFEEVSRKWLADALEKRFDVINKKFNDDGNIFELDDEVLLPFARAVVANSIAAVDGPVSVATQQKTEKMVEARLPKLMVIRCLQQVLTASMTGGFTKGQTEPAPKNRHQRKAEASRLAKSGGRGKQPQQTSA